MYKNIDTFLKIIDREKDEVLISKWVAFILNPDNTSPKIIEEILKETNSETDEVDFLKLFHEQNDELMYIRNEENIGNGSVDIMIQLKKFWIIIENKVNARETSDQSIRYEKYGKKQKLPIKYILLKPNYNTYELQNENFITIYYSKLAEILKGISIKDLKHQENYIYIQEFIKHCEIYLSSRTPDKSDIEKSEENKQKLLRKVKEAFNIYNSNEYETHDNIRYNCIQVWKKGWNPPKEISNYKGVHYEVVFMKEEFEFLNKKAVRVYLEIHNESTNNRIPKEIIPKKQSLFNKLYDFDTDENVEKSINEIATKLKQIANENDKNIDKIISKTLY